MKPYEWMAECTPQTLWIEKKGLLVWLAEVSGALGGGLYLVSLYFNNPGGLLYGWLIIALGKTSFHFAHLGQPLRFWRLILKPNRSWLARGVIFMALFLLCGAGQLLLSHLRPGSTGELLLKVLTGVLAFLVMGYAGFMMNYVRGIPLWSSGLLPLLFVCGGLAGGLALMLLIGLSGQDVQAKTILAGLRWLLCINTLLITTYLWSAAYASPTAEQSVKELTQGRAAFWLWLGVFVCGLIIPLGISLYDAVAGVTPPAMLALAAAGVLAGVFSLNYCLLKGACYGPLLPQAP